MYDVGNIPRLASGSSIPRSRRRFPFGRADVTVELSLCGNCYPVDAGMSWYGGGSGAKGDMAKEEVTKEVKSQAAQISNDEDPK